MDGETVRLYGEEESAAYRLGDVSRASGRTPTIRRCGRPRPPAAAGRTGPEDDPQASFPYFRPVRRAARLPSVVRMNAADRPRPTGAVLTDIGLGVVFALGIAFTTYMLTDSWGGTSWVLDLVIAVAVCALALLRGRWPLAAAVAALIASAVAIAVSVAAGLPREPGPVTALGLAVLVGSALRRLPGPAAAAVGAGGIAVIVSARVAEHGAVTGLAALIMIGALVTGSGLRVFDKTRPDRKHQATAARRPYP